MKALVTVFNPSMLPSESVLLEQGEYHNVTVKSSHLVNVGQTMVIGLVLHGPDQVGTHSLIDGTAVAGVVVPRCWDVSYVPTQRPLQDILSDVVAHGVREPTHGHACICMDAYIRELKLQVSRAMPPDTGDRRDVHTRLEARSRMFHVLYTVARSL